MDILEAMKERRSVRSFNGNGLTDSQKQQLNVFIAQSSNPFAKSVSIRLKDFDLKAGYRPSTYGVIKGAEDFFLLAYASDEQSQLAAGFQFEQVVLNAWRIGLGTCWIAATFKGSDFEKGETWPDREDLHIICPVGIAADKTFRERLTRLAVRSDNRKPLVELFSFKTPGVAVPKENQFRESLEMMRLAPSSTNSQPWRGIVTEEGVDFYYIEKSKLSILDCGIGLCHFMETEKYLNHQGYFKSINNNSIIPQNWKYLISYRLK